MSYIQQIDEKVIIIKHMKKLYEREALCTKQSINGGI